METCRAGLIQTTAPATLMRKPVNTLLSRRSETRDARELASIAPASVQEVLRSPGRPIERQTRSHFERSFDHEFGKVRIHHDAKAAESAAQVNAEAYAVGRDIVFGAGRYSPTTVSGRALLAHELAHTIQQSNSSATRRSELQIAEPSSPLEAEAERAAEATRHGAASKVNGSNSSSLLQRQPAPDLTTRSADQIMKDEAYMDQHLKSIEFFAAELAIIHYDDGAKLRLGLTPDYVNAPFEGVDYRSARLEHGVAATNAPGTLTYYPRATKTVEQMSETPPPGVTLRDLLVERTITFKRETASGKIVPTQVNTITAPRLCAVLQEAEKEYVAQFNALAEGGKKVFEKLKVIVELLSVLPAGEAAAAGAASKRAAGGAAAGAASAETATLTKKFAELLLKKAPGEITVGGVAFGDIEVALEGTELMVRRSLVKRLGGVPGQGKLMQAAWEAAAVQAAKQAGAKSVQLAMRTVQNETWAAYLESQLYRWDAIPKLFGQQGFERALVKTIQL
jgi:Domain of unknown function (DUF4157)